jgi:hypothetical protein
MCRTHRPLRLHWTLLDGSSSRGSHALALARVAPRALGGSSREFFNKRLRSELRRGEEWAHGPWAPFF